MADPVAIQEELWFGGAPDHDAEARAASSLAAKVGRIIGAKPFPEAARRLDQLTRGPTCPVDEVVRVLEGDPALSARLLRLVNSAGYALRMRCTSVRHASVLVGTRRLNQLATTAAVLDMFESSTVAAVRVVEHAAVVGSLCRYLAVHFGLPRDELATCGFLHDIGKLMLLDTEGAEYSSLLDQNCTPDQAHVAERERYGFDHAVLGAHVLAAWNIPDPVPKVVAWHHQPARAFQVGGMLSSMVQALRLANAIAHALIDTPKKEAIPALSGSEMASYLELSEAQLAAMWPDLEGLYFAARSRGRRDPDPEVLPRRPSVEPKSLRPSGPVSGVPKQFACVACGKGSFGSTCTACGGYACPEHWHAREQWCTRCFGTYRRAELTTPLPLAVGAGAALAVGFASCGGAIASGTSWLGAAGSGAIAAVVVAMLVAIVGRASRRVRFLRTRNRDRTPGPEVSTPPRDVEPMRVEIPRLPALPSFPAAAARLDVATTATEPAAPFVEPPAAPVVEPPAAPFIEPPAAPVVEASRFDSPPVRGAACVAQQRWWPCSRAPSPAPTTDLGNAPTEPPPSSDPPVVHPQQDAQTSPY